MTMKVKGLKEWTRSTCSGSDYNERKWKMLKEKRVSGNAEMRADGEREHPGSLGCSI